NARREDAPGTPPPGGFPPVYSDLGYLLVGALLERVAARPLDELVEDEVGRPLGLGFGSARRLAARDPRFSVTVAPTEEQAWRGGAIRGAVHDENAFALSGLGLAGHAGLFGRAADVLGLGVALLDGLAGRRDTWLRPETLWELVRPRRGGTLRAGFDSPSAEGSSAGPAFGPDAFGHLGFTGTSLWCDPAAGVVVTLLTNRVHPTRENIAIRGVRPLIHGALHALARTWAGRSAPG
ncbi:MAG: serine hydrolase, partial [Deltaproteobacteria bacterium]|nr:serine hydrolase [Deltaproteobacteria bacterium]